MSLPRQVALVMSLVVIAAGFSVGAAGPAFWSVGSAVDFLRGTSDGVYISSAGVLTAGPQLTSRLGTAPAQIWSLVETTDGTLWAGTGGDGRVIRVRPGAAAREETVFDADETHVFALAASGTRVYAATSPDGRVYAIDADGTAKPFFDPSEKYIWALAVDGAGRLWVGAGNPAVIYRVEASGASKVIYRPPAAHVVSFGRDSEGRMLAGTESPGRLYRFDANDKPFVLLDSGLTELRAVSGAATGEVFAAGLARGDDPAAASGESTSIAATIASVAPASPGAAAAAAAATPPARRSVVFRIDPTGSWETIWESPDTIYDIAAQDDGGVLAATGPEGRLYKIDRAREVLLLTGVDAKQITRFARNARGALSAFATANPGRVVSVGTELQSPATYLSPVRDTKSVAAWGLLRWEATGSVALFTRSGNTDKPDDSWSDWTGPYTAGAGEGIKSPAARFLQWRAVLTRGAVPPAAALTSVTVAYLARNTRPEVASITAHPPGVVFQRPFSSEDGAIAGLDDATADARRPPGDPGPSAPPPGRRMYQKGLQTIVWKADDDDGDHLTYALQYRREGDATWHDLRHGLSDSIFVWDTTTVSDGRYIVRVLASDEPSNAAGRALVGQRESDPIQIDNTPPVVTTEIVRQAGAARLVVRVHDAESPIAKLEYSIGGGPWQVVYPVDGLADSPDERYEIALTSDADAARLIVRAFDLLQNMTSVPAVK